MDKVKQNEEMIVSSMYEPKLKVAKQKLEQMQIKVNDQQKQMTS
jgi:hypothetical protein